MNNRLIFTHFLPLRYVSLALSVFLLGACGETLSHFSSYHQDLGMKGINYAAADRLIQNADTRLSYDTPIYGKALRRAGAEKEKKRQIPPFSGVVVEHAAQRLKRHGYNVQPAAAPGEKIRRGLVLSGVYTPKPDTVDVELVLETAGGGREISSFGYSLTRTFKIDKLLRTRPVRNEAKALMDQMIESF